MKEHARYLNDRELSAEIAKLKNEIKNGTIYNESKERDAYFADPVNQRENAEIQERMDLVTALYNARKEAGLTQKELAAILGTQQTYIAQIEKGKKNLTFSTVSRYARACGKKIAFVLQ